MLHFLLLSLSHATNANSFDFDVIVYGSTPAGIAAATAAGQLNCKVGLYEPLEMIGGMGAAGALGLHDGAGIGEGLALVWQKLNAIAYNVSHPILQPESFVAEASFRKMLENASVTIIKTNCHITGATTQKNNSANDGSRIATATFSCEEKPISAKVWIDASYDGDLMIAAGDIDYTAGREAVSQYNESLAGARTPSWEGVAGPKGINALRPDGTILKYVKNLTELGAPGTADDALMAFQHRLCISEGEWMTPWPKPEGYDPDDFLLMQRVVDATGNANAFTRMPPGPYHGYPGPKKKYDLCCGISVAASDQPNINKGWASASFERRKEIHAEHTYFELGTFYYLANDPKVPQDIRDQFSKYGLCKDEFVDNGNIPYQLYVRISNRLVSDFVLTQNNICSPRYRKDSIAVGDWSFDEHMTGKYAVPDGKGGYQVMLEGNFWPSVASGCPGGDDGQGNKYDVPYSVIVPKRGTGINLLVPVALSASAVAYSSTRIESMFMYVGTAAGVAAAEVVSGYARTVQDVNVSRVQELLTEEFRQIIHLNGSGAAPSGPAPAYYNVTGAGSSDWNGIYRSQGNHSRVYNLDSNPKHQLYSYGGSWRLAIMGKSIFYETLEMSPLPPLSGWIADNGKLPVPSLTAGPTND